MRRLALLLVGGAIWLFLAAIPVLADGGPHVSTINNGSLGINADSCAGCHRAHTAQGPMLINAADEEALCLTCHGAALRHRLHRRRHHRRPVHAGRQWPARRYGHHRRASWRRLRGDPDR